MKHSSNLWTIVAAIVAALALAGTARAQLLPGAPTAVSASDGISEDEVVVTWSAVNEADSYGVWRAPSGGASSAIGSTALTIFVDSSAVPGVRYSYSVQAQNEAGTGLFSDFDEGYAGDVAPLPPAHIAASDGALPGSVLVTWTPVLGADRYQVWRKALPNGQVAPIAVRTTLWLNDAGAQSGIRYRYWVRSGNEVGWGDFSDPDDGEAAAAAVPPVATNLTASDGSHAEFVLVTWAHPGLPIEFEVWRRALSGGSAQRIAVRPGWARWYVDSTAQVGVVHRYWVRARNSEGFSPFSAPDNGNVNGQTPPEAPDGLIATDGTHDGFVLLSWVPIVDAELYQVWRRRLPGGVPVPIGTSAGDANWFTDTTAEVGVTYRYWVRARNDVGWGPFSDPNDGSR